jgi:CRP-like cAMP-binding protein
VDYFYLLEEGQVEIIQSFFAKEENKENFDEEENLTSLLNKSIHKKHENKKRKAREIIKEPNFFGESEILKNLEHREETAICKSQTVKVFLLAKEQMEKEFLMKHPEFLVELQRDRVQRAEIRRGTIENSLRVELRKNSFNLYL